MRSLIYAFVVRIWQNMTGLNVYGISEITITERSLLKAFSAKNRIRKWEQQTSHPYHPNLEILPGHPNLEILIMCLLKTEKNFCNYNTYKPVHNKTNKMTCVPSKDSDQLGHPGADLSLRWVHRSFCWFCSAQAHIIRTLWDTLKK